MTPSEVSEQLSVPTSTLYAWRHRGQGPPAIKCVGLLRYDATELERWINERKESAGPASADASKSSTGMAGDSSELYSR